MMEATIYNVRHRLTQVIVFITCVVFCMLIAEVSEAGRPKPPRFDKHKYRVSVHSNSTRVVKVLQWKRKNPYKADNLAASSRKNRKNQAQAETDF